MSSINRKHSHSKILIDSHQDCCKRKEVNSVCLNCHFSRLTECYLPTSHSLLEGRSKTHASIYVLLHTLLEGRNSSFVKPLAPTYELYFYLRMYNYNLLYKVQLLEGTNLLVNPSFIIGPIIYISADRNHFPSTPPQSSPLTRTIIPRSRATETLE